MVKQWLVKVAGRSLPLLFITSISCEISKRPEIVVLDKVDMPSTYQIGSARPFGKLSDTTIAFFDNASGNQIQLTRGQYFKPIKKILLPKQLAGRVFSFYIENSDSILVHEVYSEYNKLTWLNGEGSILQELSINRLFDTTIETYSRSATPLIVFNKKATIHLDYIFDPPYHLKNSLLPLALQVQLDSFKVNCTFAKYPKIYQSNEYHFLTSHLRPYVIQLGGDTTLWAFHATPEVHLYKGCLLIKKSNILSENITKVPSFPLSLYGKPDEEMAFAHSSSAYSRIFYNPWQGLIYRIILPEQKYKNPDGTFNLHENRKFAIQVIDNQLNLITEKLITEPMDFELAFAGPLGLYIKTKNDESSKVVIFGLKH